MFAHPYLGLQLKLAVMEMQRKELRLICPQEPSGCPLSGLVS